MHNRLAKRNVSTTILMTSTQFGVHATDKDTGEVIDLSLAGASMADRERIAQTLCELHGIGSRKQWARYFKAKHEEAAQRKAAWKERRKAKAAANREATVERRPMHTAMAGA